MNIREFKGDTSANYGGLNMTELPISIVILTMNRYQMLTEHLKLLFKQIRGDDEIIVVDNGSSDCTSQIVRELFPSIRLITLDTNTGCGGRNIGIEAASHEIIVTLDDDVIFADDKALENIREYFMCHEQTAAMTMRILDVGGELLVLNWFHPKNVNAYANKEFETDYIPEGAVAFRKKALDETGLYPMTFFLSHEGPDLAYRIINKGWEIRYNPDVAVVHKCSIIGKTSWRFSYFDTRNQIWLAIRNYPLRRAIIYICYRLISTFIFCLQQRKLKWYFKAIFDGFTGIPREWEHRSILTPQALNRLKYIRKDTPNLLYKIKVQFVRQTMLKQIYGKLDS